MNSIAARIGDLAQLRELDGARKDFARTMRCLMIGKGHVGAAVDAARLDRAGDRVIDAVKAAQDPLSLGSVGSQLSPFQLLAQSFVQSLATVGAFDSMLPSMLRVPFRTRLVAITSTIVGTSLSEGDVKRTSSLALSASDLDVVKTAALVALTEEVVIAGGDGVLQFLEKELRQAVALATDQKFLSLITAGASTIPSGGSNLAAMQADLRWLLQAISVGTGSRLYLIAQPDIVIALATAAGVSGFAFPSLAYNGGTIAGVTVVPSDGAPAATLTLVDATGIAANSEGVRVDSSRQASLQLDSSPDSPPTASTPIVSLWQQNLLATKLERFFGAKPVRSGCVVQIVNVNYGGGSSP